MSLLYCGIDEAGYGPMLGPLTVGMAIFSVEAWDEGDPPPDLWAGLGKAVCKTARDAGERIPIADSKKLKLPNAGKRHPCAHLERAVLAGLLTGGRESPDDTVMLGHLTAALPDRPWYAGEPVPLPLAASPDALRIDANLLAGAMRSAGVTLGGLRVKLVDEAGFNEVIRRTGSKAETTTGPLSELIREAADLESDRPVRIVCDRQSGRLDYEDVMARSFPGEPVALDARTSRASRYLVRDGRVAVHFETGSEDHHLPAALASMTAKLVRELMMLRFNRHFGARLPGLRPTAGYVQDARRWLGDTRDLLTDDERKQLIRIA